MKLLSVDTVDKAKEILLSYCAQTLRGTEERTLSDAAGRILAADIISEENIPPYRRSVMDGYAVRSRDLAAAGEMIPSLLQIRGEVAAGTDSSSLKVETGGCIYVPTGGEVPEGADAVVMTEYCEQLGGGMLAVSKSVSAGENIVQIGEDISQGSIILKKGRKLRPQDIGVLAASGITSVPVFIPWKVSVISTGDELVGPREKPGPGQIRDINSYTIAARSAAEGFTVLRKIRVRDDREALSEVIKSSMFDSDVVIMSGGSSQGKKDFSAELIAGHADCGVLTHGIAARPGKPTITGFDRRSGTLFIGLPGHPAAALMVFEQILISLWHILTGCEEDRVLRAEITANVPSAPGRKTFQLIRLKEEGSGLPRAVPIFARSGMISPMSAADGYFVMSENQEGVRPGDVVDVHLWNH